MYPAFFSRPRAFPPALTKPRAHSRLRQPYCKASSPTTRGRETLAAMLTDLRGIVENARHEAGLRQTFSLDQFASQKLGQAQKGAEEYLAGVTDVLASAHGEFSESLKKALGEGYTEFYLACPQRPGCCGLRLRNWP